MTATEQNGFIERNPHAAVKHMFSKATRILVNEVDPRGSLIGVESLNDSTKLASLTLVIKKEHILSPTKYKVMDYTVLDLLDEPSPTTDVKYTDFMMDHKHITLTEIDSRIVADVAVGSGGATAGGEVASKLSLCTLTKESVDILNLTKLCTDRNISDTRKRLLPKLEKGEVLGFVTERICTSRPVTLSASTKMGGWIGATAKKFLEFFVGGRSENETSFTIPGRAVVAYSLMGLRLDETSETRIHMLTEEGSMPRSITTSIKVNVPSETLDNTSQKSSKTVHEVQKEGSMPRSITTSIILKIQPETLDNTYQNSYKTLQEVQEELQQREAALQPLAELPQSSRSALVQRLCELLDNRADLTDLEDTLEKWCSGDTSTFPKAQSACDILDLLRSVTPNQMETSSTDPPLLLKAAHLLVRAMDTLPDLIPSVLAKCSPDVLRGLNTLVSNLKVNGQSPPTGSLPASLQDGGEFNWVAEILSSASETLEELTELWVETGVKPGLFLLVLCITVQGLSLLHA